MTDRFELHTHSRYSNIRLLDALATPKQIVDRAIELGLKGICLTDHECLSGHVKMNKYSLEKAKENPDFKVGLGNEIYLVDEVPTKEHYHYLLIAKDKEGHKILRILSSLAWIKNYYKQGQMERVDTLKADLERYVRMNPGHLIATSACIGGELGKNILKLNSARQIGDKNSEYEAGQAIVNFLKWNKELFGDDFYLEIQPGVSKEQIIVNKQIVKTAKAINVKIVVNCDTHYLKKEDRYVHKSFLNSKEEEREVDAFYQDAYLHTNEEIIEKLKLSDITEQECLNYFANSMEIYDKIEMYDLFHTQQIPKVKVKDYPKPISTQGDYFEEHYPILSSMFISDDKIERYWVNECINKLNELDKNNDKYLSRLEEEANTKKIIGEKLGTNIFAYPVTLQKNIDIFWQLGSPVGAGRGSSCSGLNHYLLGVTQLDPLEWNFPFWRYLNPERIELPDIDLDLAPSKRPIILDYIKKERGKNFYDGIDGCFRTELGCTLVATFGTETAKSAVQTACRGYRAEGFENGIDSDTGLFLSSLIPKERGFVWSVSDTYYGNEKEGRKPVAAFKTEIDKYPGLLEIILGIEGLISRRGSHASGVIFNDEDPFEFLCYMRTPSGDITTQYDLHDAEYCGATKYDFLVTEVQDKIAETIRLLQEDDKIEKDLTLREVYDKYLHPNVLPIEDKEIWKLIQDVKVLSLFQFDSPVGKQAAKKIKPSSMSELSDSNGLMRLMPLESGETPLDKYVRFKNDISQWYAEMRNEYGLSDKEITAVERHFKQSYGVPPSQEQLMTMLMDEDICHFTLAEANAARKTVGKKVLSEVPKLHEKVLTQASSPNLGRYIWECGIGPQMSYAFSCIHATAYSFIAFQSAYLCAKYNPIYWNTACLIVDSGSLENNVELVDIYEKEDFENYNYTDLPNKSGKIKEKGSDYAKIASAIGSIMNEKVKVSLVDINKSDYSFKPDVENNRILYALKAVNRIGSDVIEKIKKGRPYSGIKDFMKRCPLNKTVMVNLIKAGAFDETDKAWAAALGEVRKVIMAYYLSIVSEPKTKLNMQNFNGLMQKNLIPDSLDFSKKVFVYNKDLKKVKKGNNLIFDDMKLKFYEEYFDLEDLEYDNGITYIDAKKWDKQYKIVMQEAKEWLIANQDNVLKEFNYLLFKESWDKYAKGSISAWEMESICFYYHEHELSKLDNEKYGLVDFNSLSSESAIERYWTRNGRQIPIYKLSRICGTVLAKDDNRSSVTLLTTTGVVTVKFTREYYAMFKTQLSEKQEDGKKKVVEKGWFTRGNKIIVTGYRREDSFVGKTYKNTPTHQLYLITNISEDGTQLELQHERYQVKTV